MQKYIYYQNMIMRISRAFQKSISVKRLETFLVPQPGEGIAEITITKWLVHPNQHVKEFDKVCEVYSDKSSLEFKSPYDGIISELLHEPSDTVKVGDPLYKISINDIQYPPLTPHTKIKPTPDSESPRKLVDSPSFPIESPPEHLLLSPSARHLANKHKIPLSKLIATGRKGMVIKDDIIAYIETSANLSKKDLENPKHTDPPSMPSVTFDIKDQSKKLSPMQKAMKKTMTASLSIPHLTFCEDIYMDNIIELRNQLKIRVKDVKLTLMPFLIKCISLAMMDYPLINSSLMESKTEVLLRASHNVCFAMDTAQGLVVPNIKNVGSKSIYEIAVEMNRLKDLGSKGRLSEEDLREGTVTVSNIGSIGGNYVAPVILTPQVFIGAFGAVRPRLERVDGKIVERNVLATSWSADHRVLDGATTARFVARFKAIIESPSLMLMHLK